MKGIGWTLVVCLFTATPALHAGLVDFYIYSGGNIDIDQNANLLGNVGAIGSITLGGGGGASLAAGDALVSNVGGGSAAISSDKSLLGDAVSAAGGLITGTFGSTDATGSDPLLALLLGAQADFASQTAALQVPVGTLQADPSGTAILDITGSSGFYDYTTLTLGNNDSFTVNGGSSDYAFIRVGTLTLGQGGNLLISGSLPASNVLYLVTNQFTNVNNTDVFGTILSLDASNCTLKNNFTLTGQFACGTDLNINNNFNKQGGDFVPFDWTVLDGPSGPQHTPEPSTYLLIGVGLSLILLGKRRGVVG